MSAKKKQRSGNPAKAVQRSAEAMDAREARQAKAAALRQREKAAERRRKVTIITVAALAVVALVAVLAVVFVNSRKDSAGDGRTPTAAVSDSGGIVLPGSPAAGAAPTLDIWLDYQCPVCKQFEDVGGEAYVDLAANGSARVVVHTLTFLDDNLRNTASQLAAEGAAAAADQGKFVEYTQLVFTNQPDEGVGYTLDKLQGYAELAGVADIEKWRSDVEDRVYEDYVDRVQASMAEQDVTGTPTVRVTPAAGGDYTQIDASQLLTDAAPENLRQAIVAAGGTVSSDPSADPSPSSSPSAS